MNDNKQFVLESLVDSASKHIKLRTIDNPGALPVYILSFIGHILLETNNYEGVKFYLKGIIDTKKLEF